MAKFKDNILSFTDEEALNQEVSQDKWEVIRKVWSLSADSSATPPIIGFRPTDEDDGTVHLDVTDCSSLTMYAYATWFGIFSESPIVIGISGGVGAKTYNTSNMIKRPWRYAELPVPKGAKYFNYRVSDYGSTNTKQFTILALKQ